MTNKVWKKVLAFFLLMPGALLLATYLCLGIISPIICYYEPNNSGNPCSMAFTFYTLLFTIIGLYLLYKK